jgi:hypothetical protein
LDLPVDEIVAEGSDVFEEKLENIVRAAPRRPRYKPGE